MQLINQGGGVEAPTANMELQAFRSECMMMGVTPQYSCRDKARTGFMRDREQVTREN